MKKIILITGLLFSVFISAVSAQGAAGNAAAATTTKAKHVSPNPGRAAPSAKPPVAQKEPRRAKTSSPEIEIKPVKK